VVEALEIRKIGIGISSILKDRDAETGLSVFQN